MNIQNAIAISLIIITIGLVFWVFIRPAINPKQAPAFITDEQLEYMGTRADGVNGYLYFKQEMADWIKMISQLMPIVTLISAIFIKKKKK